MEKDVLINIRGVYHYEDEEEDVVELFTTGTYQTFDDYYLIGYEESEATGFEGSYTTLRIGKDRSVTMSRTGQANTELIIQNGVRHQCHYDSGHGDMVLGVNGHLVTVDFNEQGGDLVFKYSLDMNSVFVSKNEMYINVKERIS